MTPAAVLLTAHRSRRETCTRAALKARTLAFRYADEGEPVMAKLFLSHQRDMLDAARHWRAKERELRTKPAIRCMMLVPEGWPPGHAENCDNPYCRCQAYLPPADLDAPLLDPWGKVWR